MPTQYHAAQLWDGEQWHQDVRLLVNSTGTIEDLQAGPAGAAKTLPGPVIPALVNAHSHAFQRAMAGWAEQRVGDDDFWRWRELMYRLALNLSSDQLEAIAAQAMVEMLAAGYTQVCEFHYLHLDREGQPHVDLAHNAKRMLSTAQGVGIGMTMLPALYQRADFGSLQVTDNQRRFRLRSEQFVELMGSLQDACSRLDSVGVAFHSLRAVSAETIAELLPKLGPGPRHLHISEQPAEVASCLKHHGRPPIEHLARYVELDRDWSLVHATHASQAELDTLLNAAATVVLCPTTEANLGDGRFPIEHWLERGGRFAIGSDSQVTISPAAELELLEYGQRLQLQRRAVVANPHCGVALWGNAGRGGARAAGVKVGRLKPGWRADWLVLDQTAPGLVAMTDDRLLDGLVFGPGQAAIRDVFVAGQQVISGGRHPRAGDIANRFRTVMEQLHSA